MPTIKTILAAASLALMAACTTGRMTIPDAGSPGARLYAKRCQGCHALPHPQRLTAGQWDHMLGIMQQRMRERGVPTLDADEFETIQGYLHRHALR